MTKQLWFGGLSLLLAVMAVHMVIKNNTIPSGLGVQNQQLAPLPASPNAISSQASDAGRKVEPLLYLQNRAASRQRLLQVMQSEPRTRIISDTGDYIHAVFTMPIIPFHDDVEFFFDDLTQTIHLRSASRVGWSDLGVNRKRVETIRRLYLADSL